MIIILRIISVLISGAIILYTADSITKKTGSFKRGILIATIVSIFFTIFSMSIFVFAGVVFALITYPIFQILKKSN